MKAIEIVPGKAIGPVRLGAAERDLPAGAQIADGVGSVDHIHFSLEGGKVDDVWIEDLGGFPYNLQLKGESIPRPASLEKLKSILGECRQVEGILGGIFYNCRGVTIGCDQTGRPIQLRLKPR